MERINLKKILEGMIFASDEPLKISDLAPIFENSGAGKTEIKEAIEELKLDYDQEGHGLLLRQVGEGYQFVTKPDLAEWLQKLTLSKPRTLSQASLETLAIIAYRQPIVRSEVDVIRGVDSGGVLKTLLERGLIKILGRKEEAGQPLIYGTTLSFLELFHLTTLEELPSMKEIEELVEIDQKTQSKAVQQEFGEGEEEKFGLEGDAPLPLTDEEKIEGEEALNDLDESLKELKDLEKMFSDPEKEKSS